MTSISAAHPKSDADTRADQSCNRQIAIGESTTRATTHRVTMCLSRGNLLNSRNAPARASSMWARSLTARDYRHDGALGRAAAPRHRRMVPGPAFVPNRLTSRVSPRRHPAPCSLPYTLPHLLPTWPLSADSRFGVRRPQAVSKPAARVVATPTSGDVPASRPSGYSPARICFGRRPFGARSLDLLS